MANFDSGQWFERKYKLLLCHHYLKISSSFQTKTFLTRMTNVTVGDNLRSFCSKHHLNIKNDCASLLYNPRNHTNFSLDMLSVWHWPFGKNQVVSTTHRPNITHNCASLFLKYRNDINFDVKIWSWTLWLESGW